MPDDRDRRSVLIRGGQVVLPADVARGDVRIVGASIAAIEPSIVPEAGDEIIEADGLLVLPGIIDCHTHFQLDTGRMTTRDDFEGGSISAAAGGVTTYMNFAPQQRGQSLVEAVRNEQEKADGHSVVDYSLHLSFGTPSRHWETELAEAVRMGVTSIKVYTTYTDTIFYTRDWDWYRLMQRTGELGALVQVHAENDDIVQGQTAELLAEGKRSFRYHGAARPAVAETEAVARGLIFARDTGSPIYFVHLSSPESVSLVAEARAEGVPAYGEVCVHHITLDDALYDTPQATRFIMTPPLRDRRLALRLLSDVADREVQVVATDHCAYGLDQRGGDDDFTACSPGIPGVETLFPVLYTTLVESGRMALPAAANLVTRNPAAIFGLYPRKGLLAPGSDADITLYDPEPRTRIDERELHSKAGYSPWNGFEVRGRVVRTISRGRTIWNEGELDVAPGHGQFIPCRPFARATVDAVLGIEQPVGMSSHGL